MTQGSVVILIDSSERIIVQRRDSIAPRNANLLTLFGGHRESGETARECLRRELTEETSLDIASLRVEYLFVAPVQIQNAVIKLSVFKAKINNQNFEVYEGICYEKYMLRDLLIRKDLVSADRLILNQFVVSHI